MAERDKPDYNDIRKLTAMVEETYRVRRKALRRISKGSNWTDDSIDYGDAHIKRRASATVKTTASLMTRVADFCPNIPDVFYGEEEWASINATTFSSYDNMEDGDTLSLAAAIWILDNIKAAHNLHKAMGYLPSDEDELYDVHLPEIWDACHSDEILRSMVYAIQERNADCSAGKKRSSKSDGCSDRIFMDDYTAEDIHHQDVPSRQRFDALLALIPQEDIDRAVKHCEEKMWEWADRYFKCRAIFAKEEYDLQIKTEKFYRQTEAKANELKDKREQMDALLKSKAPVMSPLMMQPKAGLFPSLNDPLPNEMNELLGFMEGISSKEAQLDNANEELSDRISAFQRAVQFAHAFPPRTYRDDFGEEIAAIMDDFSIDDPYEICFGMLYLIDQGCDLPWAYCMGLNVLHQARIRLPWYIGEYDEEDDPIWNDMDDSTDGPLPEGEDVDEASIAAPEMPDWFSLDYVDQSQDPLFQFDVNLAQIVYELTGAIMPRNLHRYDPTVRELSNYGIKKKKESIPLLYCMTLMGEAQRQSRVRRNLFSEWDLAEEIMAQLHDDDDDDVASADSVEQLQSDIAALKNENERLKRTLHMAEREAREAQKQNKARTKAAENQRHELADLRTLIFNQQADAFEDDAPSDPSIEFPYETKRRTLVFGGHESWTREMKPRLPDVRYVGKDVVLDVNLLRNADVIWLQTNCLSHKQYDKIMGVARGRDIPVRYFSYASAMKCAEQMVHEDRKV